MVMPMTAEDIVVGLLCRFDYHHKKKFSADRETLHRAFYSARTKFPNVLSIFTFRQREQFPESEQLDQALSNLDATGLISRQNLTPRYYVLETTALQSGYDKFSKKILSGHGISESQLDEIALELESLVGNNG